MIEPRWTPLMLPIRAALDPSKTQSESWSRGKSTYRLKKIAEQNPCSGAIHT
jgi:hypothetical protein